MPVKKEIRVLGIDDMPFDKFHDKKTKVVGVVFRGGQFMDGVVSTDVEVDGDDATQKQAEMVAGCRFRRQMQCILLDGIAVGGFNVIDIHELSEKTKLGVIVVMRALPKIDEIYAALQKLGMDQKIEILKKSGNIILLELKQGKIFYQIAGITQEKAEDILRTTTTHSFIPESIRVAHLIGQGIVLGESKGSA